MFWDSVVGGLKVLTFWETYVAGVECFVLFTLPIVFTSHVMEKQNAKGWHVGCMGTLVMQLFQVAGIAVFVLTLAPIIFGLAEDASWSLPWKVITLAPGLFLRLVGVLVVMAIVLEFLGLAKFQSLQTLVLGAIVLVFALAILSSANPELVSGKLDFIPGLRFTVGLLVIGGIMAWIGILVAAIIMAAIERSNEGLGQLVLIPVGTVLGFIPVFMYGSWLGSQLEHGS